MGPSIPSVGKTRAFVLVALTDLEEQTRVKPQIQFLRTTNDHAPFVLSDLEE
uniref:Uncharacterized protein n=1 Tax=Parascaris univalens TaxID=6257 RepID=A0A915A413_PARUN